MATITRRGKSWFVQIRKKGFTPRYQTFSTKNEALIWAREQEGKIDTRSAPTAPLHLLNASLSDLIERYKQEVTPAKRSSDTELLRLSKLQRHPICELAIKDVSPEAVAAYRDQRLLEVKSGTIRRELSLLHHLFDMASKEWGFRLGQNPVRNVSMPKCANGRDRRLETGEYSRLLIALQKVQNQEVRAIVRLAIETAMRRGEILSLHWQNIDLEARTAFIPQTKTGYSRTIPLNDEAHRILSNMPKSDGAVFSIKLAAFKSAWQRLRVRTGMPDLRFHDLRHEAISRFCELGLSLPEVALISGHRDPRMLFRYTHLKPTALAQKLIGRSWLSESATR